MKSAFIALGSNLGDRLSFLQMAVSALEKKAGVKLESASPVYETEPVGNRNQPHFLNAVVKLSSTLSAESLLLDLKDVERSVGRTPSEKWGPREIDLDLIYYSDFVIDSPTLVIPHPEIERRRFVLAPLADIAADFVDPLRKRTVRELLRDCTDASSISRIPSSIRLQRVES